MAYEQGTPDRVPPDQPDPVMVGPGLSTLGEGAYKRASTVTPAVVSDGKPSEPAAKEDGPSYFSDVPGTTSTKDAYAKSPATPAEAASGATSGPELLRRLSLVGGGLTPASPVLDPRTAHPGLKLSGRIISAAFCIPYKVAFEPGSDWELKPRPGTSALFDSFAHLASDKSPWSHILVGWTGEVEPIQKEQRPPLQPVSANGTPAAISTLATGPATQLAMHKVAAPVPVGYHQKPSHPVVEGVKVSKADRDRLESQLRSSKYGKIFPVWLSAESDEPSDDIWLKDQSRWRRYPERALYPLLHYKQNGPTDGRSERKWWTDYLRMNRLFADRIAEIYQAGDIVWIHDYHLFLLPSLLRQRIPNIYIGFFLHAPFPSSEYLRCLAKRKEVLEGVLGANMIGFQTYSYSRHFSSCCTRILGFDSNPAGVDAYGAHVAVDVFPTGIDAQSVQKLAFGAPDIEEVVLRIKKLYAGKKIIVGRDRLDSVRGVAQKLLAFETFLDRYPQWREKVVLIQVTSPTSMEEEKEDPENKIGSQVSNLVSTINGRFGSLSFTPVQYYPQYISQQEYFSLLRVADVGLITSVRDGMNTTSLEYVLCQQNNHGPLILSEFSGTAAMLPSAIHINPWDLSGVAAAIDRALTMSEEEKAEQHRKLYKHVTSNTVSAWSQQYLNRLLTNLSSFDQSIVTPALDRSKLLKQYRKAKKRLFMFDYDGTLTPIVKDPQAAIPSDRVLRTIKTLAADPKNAVWIISGRDQAFLDEWMGHIPELGLSAEHGCFIRKPRSDDWENLAAQTDMGWQKEVMDIFQHYTERTQGAFIERKRVALTWHYRRADPEYGAFQAKECRKHLEETVMKKWDVEVMAGKANLEVRPTFVNKGFIATRLVNEYGTAPGEPPDFVLCLGDDFTDEDMFRALRNSDLPPEHVFSVTVGASSKQTLASWHLLEPADVIATIGSLNSSSITAEY
ncbi:Alpha,alpha-trehalose-phosphate synthase (UDP-forming) [Rasamsonia emersonii CBS 393.64]|uniref:Alpha,alpha-trehalose-phosphate synthase (UDP-forming) n=1 Tax=Rasamsonia emersonii (strain ATCC 16479 / CBS 393.64 / IMI 116815) TaxID=1408163 RepID=A0A0F4YFU6_RASE3|nr:Alpha,alpha-trehalose-phosphate synthase (UDP-forming) [Rasamsonia emersonii CBS 393.64]KKA16990.1 Alpha,alpha-trehalose-phosphate synthase (UDP-forming) [Rasamsonia emersonii CBS 393.64]